MKKNLFSLSVSLLLISCGGNTEARLDKMQQELDSLKAVVATVNGTYSKAVEAGSKVSGPKSEDVAERALQASKDQAIKGGMTEEEIIAVLGQPSKRDHDTNGCLELYYGTSDCYVKLGFLNDGTYLCAHDWTHGKFDEAW